LAFEFFFFLKKFTTTPVIGLFIPYYLYSIILFTVNLFILFLFILFYLFHLAEKEMSDRLSADEFDMFKYASSTQEERFTEFFDRASNSEREVHTYLIVFVVIFMFVLNLFLFKYVSSTQEDRCTEFFLEEM
jgi:hypothetical protein